MKLSLWNFCDCTNIRRSISIGWLAAVVAAVPLRDSHPKFLTQRWLQDASLYPSHGTTYGHRFRATTNDISTCLLRWSSFVWDSPKSHSPYGPQDTGQRSIWSQFIFNIYLFFLSSLWIGIFLCSNITDSFLGGGAHDGAQLEWVSTRTKIRFERHILKEQSWNNVLLITVKTQTPKRRTATEINN